jgi:DNA-binding CsgD family transcriptional regulator/tetratricopeptide (TPR) repeat protein
VEVTSATREAGAARLVGRDDELGRLRALVDPVPAGSRLLVVRGDAGMGKTALLADLASRAVDAGMRVLLVTGQKSEDTLAFAGLQQLLRPLLAGASRLPEPQATAILAVLGLTPDPVAPDRLLTGTALLNLLAELSAESGLLVVADDAHWLDRSSLDALAFASRRLAAERIALVLGVRGNAALPGFDHDVEELRLRPLAAADASRLLDQQPLPPRGRARQQVLSQAAGNPMALIELSSAIAADPAARQRWDAEPLPLTDRLTAVITAQLEALPAATRHALLLASIADRGDGAAAIVLSGLEPGALVPAEELGLVKVGTARVRFSHPVVRSAVYHGAPFASRGAAHLGVAATLGHDQLDQRAWHLAAAALHPDERVASLLVATASQAQCRGGAGAAALALERAAELSPDPEMAGQRLVSAATIAIPTGQAEWIRDLATRALAVTCAPDLRIRARRAVGWALAWSGRHAAALPELISVAEEASASLTVLAWEALAIAASVAYQCGAPTALRRVEKTLGVLEQAGPPSGDSQCRELDALRLWIQASIGACADRGETARRLDLLTGARLEAHLLYRAGSAAWVLDQPQVAIELLRAARRGIRASAGHDANGGSIAALGWAYIDAGRWDDALSFAAEADAAASRQPGVISASADLISGTVMAARGDTEAARTRIHRALAHDPEQSRLVTTRSRHALGLAALADGDHIRAYGQLRQLFTDDGQPLHHHVSYLGVADLAAAARADRTLETRLLLGQAEAAVTGTQSPRLAQLFSWSLGTLADPETSGTYFDKALSDPAGDLWPFERARLNLDYGEWLRRRRRINEAKPLLAASLETFGQLGARPWIQQAKAELRACGVSVSGAPDGSDALSELTSQQREIVSLAASGLTNREIASRLFLSPRTVGSHLYRAYPKLGISGRHQLGSLIAQAGPPPGEGRRS